MGILSTFALKSPAFMEPTVRAESLVFPGVFWACPQSRAYICPSKFFCTSEFFNNTYSLTYLYPPLPFSDFLSLSLPHKVAAYMFSFKCFQHIPYRSMLQPWECSEVGEQRQANPKAMSQEAIEQIKIHNYNFLSKMSLLC